MGEKTRPVARVRAGATLKSTLATKWGIDLSAIEFIKDVPMSENGYNRADRAPDVINYLGIRENFHGWGRGAQITGWDWQGFDNLERPACYVRKNPIVMKVRLRCSPAAPSDRTFTLVVDPSLDGDTTLLTTGSKAVTWKKGSKEEIIEITTGGALPDEVSRFGLRLTWSAKDIAISAPDGTTTPGKAGVIAKTNHTVFGIFDDPREPADHTEEGRRWYVDTGCTKQRLDKITQVIGGTKRRFPTAKPSDIEELVWMIHKDVNDTHNPVYFDGQRSFKILYLGKPSKTSKTKKKLVEYEIGLIDQWVMWAPSDATYPGKFPHWNYGACVTYAQLMKTMLATIGIHTRLAWVIPKTTHLPNGTDKALSESDLVDFDTKSDLPTQKWTFLMNATASHPQVAFYAEVVLVERPEKGGAEQFEGCLWYKGRFYPGAIATEKYPSDILKDRRGFPSGAEVLKWWRTVRHTGSTFSRFMAWWGSDPTGALKPDGPTSLFFDKDGNPFLSPYDIPDGQKLPLANP